MAEHPDEIRRGLIAERRSLLITSLVLFFYVQAGLRIDEINILGNRASVADPWWVSFALWVLWVYFFLRYFEYYLATTGRSFSEAYDERLVAKIRWYASQSFLKSFKDKYNPTQILRAEVVKTDFPASPSRRSVILTIKVTHADGTEMGELDTERLRPVQLIWARFNAAASVVFFTPYFTEYYLPFIIGLLPLGSFLLKQLP